MSFVKSNQKLNYFKKEVSEGDVISEIFQYPIPKEIYYFKIKLSP